MDFFPYSSFWRVRGQQKTSNRCSIIVSILVILILVALLVERIILVAKKETITASSQTMIDSFPPKSQVTSDQNNQDQSPFMMAIEDLSNNYWFKTCSIRYTLYTESVSGSGRFSNSSVISVIPSICPKVFNLSQRLRLVAKDLNQTLRYPNNKMKILCLYPKIGIVNFDKKSPQFFKKIICFFHYFTFYLLYQWSFLIINASNVISSSSNPALRFATQIIETQPCTAEHFSKFPNFKKANSQNWLCFPLKENFSFFGFDAQASQHEILRLSIQIDSCSTNIQNYVSIYILSTIINPTNGIDPEQYYLKELRIPIRALSNLVSVNAYKSELSENIVTTDNSLMPWESNHQYRSWTPEQLQVYQQIEFSDPSITALAQIIVTFQRSIKTYRFKRSFYKLTDALSYIGGMFQVVVGVFFFMDIVGRLFFEIELAKKCFKTKITQSFGFKESIHQLLFRFCTAINCKPEWQIAEKRQKIINTVNNLMDVTYLQKRLNFLEKALAVVFEKHQFSSLFLCRTTNEEESDSIYKAHHLRDRLIRYLSLRTLENKLNEFVQQDEKEENTPQSTNNLNEKVEMKLSSKTITNKEQISGSAIKKRGQQTLHITDNIIIKDSGQHVIIESHVPLYENQQSQFQSEHYSQTNKKDENAIRKENKATERRKKTESQRSEQPQPRRADDRNFEEEKQKLREAIQNVDPIDMNDLDAPQIEEWIRNDFRKIVTDSEKMENEEISRKIYNSMEGWLKNMLKDLLMSQKFDCKDKILSRQSKLIEQ